MRIAEVAKLFAGSCFIYVVVAACSAYSGDEPPTGGLSAPSRDGSNADSLLDPVPNALAEGHKSGSRLKLRFYEGSDGSRQFIDFYDSELKTRCSVAANPTTTDNKIRCLPPVLGTMLYSDDKCATPVAYAAAKSGEQPTVASVRVIAQNREAREHYALGGLTNPPAGTIYQGGQDAIGNGEGCAATSVNGTANNHYAVGAPLAPAAFVEMTIKNE